MHKRSIRRVVLATLVGFAPLAVHAANLVTNGDFDNTANTWVNNTGDGGDDQLSGGATPVPGWTSATVTTDYLWVGPNNSYGLTASPGNGSGYFIDLTGQGDGHPYGGIEQTIATVSGATYMLKFDLGASTIYNSAGTGSASVIVAAQGATAQTATYT